MTEPVIVIGSGGHAAVVADALLASGKQVIGFTDTDPTRYGQLLCGLPVLGSDHVLQDRDRAALRLANGIGGTGSAESKNVRRAVQENLESLGWRFVGVRHPSAIVSRFASVGDGVHLLASCVIQAGAVIGDGCIVNTAAVVEHDATIGRYTHVACGAVLCGAVSIGTGSHIGAGAVVRQGVRLGDEVVVGAGAVVVEDSQCGATLVGVPAREKRISV